jgi:hypothetical protein
LGTSRIPGFVHQVDAISLQYGTERSQEVAGEVC